MICSKCGHANPPGTKYCRHCGFSLSPTSSPSSAATLSPVRWYKLLLYLVPLILAFVPQLRFSTHGLAITLITTLVITFTVRGEVIALIRHIETTPELRPLWRIQSTIPGFIRKILGFVVPVVLSYLVTEQTEFGGFQSMILSIVISTPVAYYFFREPFV